jgi:signal transduction histidine kinase
MWTAKETLRVLRGQKNLLRDAWQAEAQAQLPHLNQRILARRGAAQQCTASTLASLIRCYEQYNTRMHATAMAGDPSEEAPGHTSDAALTALLGEQYEADWRECATQWAALPLSWPDIRTLLRILTTCLCRALSERGADANAHGLIIGTLATLTALAAEQRMIEIERQSDTHREENLTTHHLAGRFLANASHDLRTPLTAVMGFSDLLLEDTYGELNDAQRIAVGHIENSAQNLLEIVNNLLDLLKVRSGELKLFYRQVAIAPLLRELYKILTPLAERKKVRFSLQVSDALGAIEADENIVRHIVYHLLTSSLRATPANGGVEVSGERRNDSVTILIRDTALHLPQEAIANMADSFPRLENSPVRGYEGWEIGLPLVRRYIDLHGGRLEIESLPDRGTVFHVVLPLVATRSAIDTQESER